MMVGRPSLSRLVVALSLLAAVAGGPRVAAQVSDDFARRYFAPWVPSDAFERFLAQVAWTDATDEAWARALYADLTRAYDRNVSHFEVLQAKAAEARRTWEAANPGRQPWGHDGIDFGDMQINRNWAIDRFDLEIRFDAELRERLDAPAAAEWTDLARRARRERVLYAMYMYGVRRPIADLVDALDGLGLTAAETEAIRVPRRDYIDAAEEMLERWERKDPRVALAIAAAGGQQIERTPILEIVEPAQTRYGGPEERDGEEIQRLLEKQLAAIRTVREITDAHARAIIGALGPERGETFRRAVGRVVYPKVFTESPVDLFVRWARDGRALDADRLRSIEEIYAEYAVRRAAVQEAMAASTWRWENPTPVERERRAEIRRRELALRDGDPGLFQRENPIIPLVRQRRALAAEACGRIREVLGQEELERLPLGARIFLGWSAESGPD